MGKKSPPPAPDYVGAAEATAKSSRELATANTTANRPTQVTPWGTSSWASSAGVDPSTGLPVTNWTQNIELTGPQQQALDAQMRVQAGRSDLAEGLIGRAGQELGTPMDWDGLPKPAGTPDVPGFYGKNLPSMGSAPTAYGGPQFDYAGNYNRMQDYSNGPEAQSMQSQLRQPTQNVSAGGAEGSFGQPTQGVDAGRSQTSFGQPTQRADEQAVQRSLDYSGQQALDAGGGFQQRFADQQFERQMSLMSPQHEQASNELETRMRNQGLNPGDAAYEASLQRLRTQQGEEVNRLTADSVRFGTDQQQAQFGREMSARQQGVSEVNNQGQFANAAAQQMNQQQMALRGQQYQEGLTNAEFGNEALNQQFGRESALRGQQYQEGLTNAEFGNAANQQNFNQGFALRGQQGQESLQEGQFANDASTAQFDQNLAQSNYQNQLRGQQFGELNTLQDQYAGVQQGDFDRQLAAAKYQDEQRRQLGQEQLAMGDQGFSQQMQAANYQNSLRQQAIAEEMQRRGMSINEMNALLSGQQVSMPGMPDFNAATMGQATDYSGAANMQGDFAQQSYATALGPLNAAIGATSLAIGG